MLYLITSILMLMSIKLLTIGGQIIWEEENTLHIDNDILNPNDIYRKNAQQLNMIRS